MIDWFHQRGTYQIELLRLHNADGRRGQAVSLLGEHDSRAIAVAQLRRDNKCFYFCELLAGGRAAFLYKEGCPVLVETDFADLFRFFKKNHLDWLECKQHLPASGLDYLIHPRNRYNGGVAIALRCDKFIGHLLLRWSN